MLPVLCCALVRSVVDELHLVHVKRVTQVVRVVVLFCPWGKFYTLYVVCTESKRHESQEIIVLRLVELLFVRDRWHWTLGACVLYVVGLFDVVSVMHARHTVEVHVTSVVSAECQRLLDVL